MKCEIYSWFGVTPKCHGISFFSLDIKMAPAASCSEDKADPEVAGEQGKGTGPWGHLVLPLQWHDCCWSPGRLGFQVLWNHPYSMKYRVMDLQESALWGQIQTRGHASLLAQRGNAEVSSSVWSPTSTKRPRAAHAHTCEQVQPYCGHVNQSMYDCHFKPLSFGVAMLKYPISFEFPRPVLRMENTYSINI